MPRQLDIAAIVVRLVPPPGWADREYDRALREVEDIDPAYQVDRIVRLHVGSRTALDGVRIVTTTTGDDR
jgi:hypothetical protein